MRLLLDTNVLWWMFYEPDRLRPHVVGALGREGAELHYSPLSVAELVVKRQSGKFSFDEVELLAAIVEGGIREVPVRGRHAARTGALPVLHKDPFDRLLIAQAIEEGMTLVSSDGMFRRYGVAVIQA